MKQISLEERMKGYEKVSNEFLLPNTPIIIRLDGKAFHTFTKKFKTPFDELFLSSMQETMRMLCESVYGCVFGYTQSDEITLVLLGNKPWYDNRIQKICSISASMATLYFNRIFYDNVKNNDLYNYAVEMGATFDSRCFNVPNLDEVVNCIVWRQLDATRNSVQSSGQAYFSHKQLLGKSNNEVQDMLFKERGINWNNFETYKKRGSCCVRYKVIETIDLASRGVDRKNWPTNATEEGIIQVEKIKWAVDTEIPDFSKYDENNESNKNYILKNLY